MKLATFALAATLMVAGAAAFSEPAYPLASTNGTRNIMGMDTVVSGLVQGIASLPGRMGRGDFVVNGPRKATPKEEVTDVGCLNTKIPEPLNWGPLWCAGKEAKVLQWYDEAGSLHRTVDIPVQPNVTANMVIWMFSPLFPQFLEYKGKMWFWYHLWHPFDHVMAANKLAPSSANIGMPGLYTLIHERYRNLPAEKAKNMTVFETDAWFHVEDLISNFLKKRIVISINTGGLQAWTLIVNLKDTPAGLKIDNELIIGAAIAGYDPTDPSRGAPVEAAVIVNDNLVKPMLQGWAKGAEFDRSINAITRHVVEEFSMFRFFLPEIWNRFPHLQGMFALSDKFNALIPRLNYGPFMKLRATNAAGLTEMMMPLNKAALHNLTQLHEAVGKMPGAVAKSLQVSLQSQIKQVGSDYNEVTNVLNTHNATKIAHKLVRMAVPSAVGAVPEP